MFDNNPEILTVIREWPYAMLATIGGFLGYVLRSLDRSTGIQWGRAVIETLAAGFVGIMVLLLCHAAGLEGAWPGFIAGVFGWAGAPASMIILEKVIFKKLGIHEPDALRRDNEEEDLD